MARIGNLQVRIRSQSRSRYPVAPVAEKITLSTSPVLASCEHQNSPEHDKDRLISDTRPNIIWSRLQSSLWHQDLRRGVNNTDTPTIERLA
jgi:hypothetical protein